MVDKNWQKVREVFDSVLSRPMEDRQNYVVEVCGEDKILLAEVKSLLLSLDSAENFMETPAVAKVAEAIENNNKKLEKDRKLGHYEIIEQIGTGGMGEVYLAKDTNLDRKVAVKILSEKISRHESNVKRFISEAKAASALNHPNILTIYEFGEADDVHFIVSEFIEGKTLREIIGEFGMKLSEILDISIQIGSALSAAHKAHLIHRDIKPENVMIRPDGYVKILDFGLAKLIEQKSPSFLGSEDSVLKPNQTAKGVILGTVNYMSPEQAKGEWVDERTDIFSFGILVYEMLTGRTPFASDSTAETLANLINREPPLLRFAEIAPKEVQHIVSKMLRKNAADRYQTMKEVITDLKDLGEHSASGEHSEKSTQSDTENTTKFGPGKTGDTNLQTNETDADFRQQNKRQPFAAFKLLEDFLAAIGFGKGFFKHSIKAKQIESVAVLPFVNVADDPETEYLSDGISENLIDRLSQLPQLKVIARSSSFKYRGENTDIFNAAKQLGVRAIITGRVARRGDNISIRVEMVDAFDNRQLWGEQYNRRAADLQLIQQEIAQTVSEKLRLKLSGAQKQEIAKQKTVNPKAYELLLKGHSHRNKKGTENKMKAAAYYQQAIDIDPFYAAAHAALSVSISDLTHNSILDPKEFTPKAEAAAQKALDLDENLAEAHDAMALIKLNGWNWAAAEQEYQRAIELNPNFAKVHSCYAFYLSLVGRHDEAIAEFKLSKDINPLAPVANADIGYALYMARRYDEAQEILNIAVEMDRENPYPNAILAHNYLGKGMYAEAVAGFSRVMELGGEPGYRIYLGAAYAKAGEREQAQTILRQLENDKNYVSRGELAVLYATLGDYDKTFSAFERAYDAHDAQLQFLWVEPAFDALRSDSRFQDLLRRVGLPQ